MGIADGVGRADASEMGWALEEADGVGQAGGLEASWEREEEEATSGKVEEMGECNS